MHRFLHVYLSENPKSHVICFVVRITTLSHLSVVLVEDWDGGGRDEIDVLSGIFVEGLTKADYGHVNGYDRTITVILANHCIKLPDDGSHVIRNMLEQF